MKIPAPVVWTTLVLALIGAGTVVNWITQVIA